MKTDEFMFWYGMFILTVGLWILTGYVKIRLDKKNDNRSSHTRKKK